MARFAQQQKAFMESEKSTKEEPGGKEEEEEEPSSLDNDYETISTGVLCALCRSEAPPAEGRVLALVALLEPTRILPTAKSQDIGKYLDIMGYNIYRVASNALAVG